MPFLESPDGAWIQAQLAHMTQQARDSGRYDKNLTQAELFCPGSDELRDTISKLVRPHPSFSSSSSPSCSSFRGLVFGLSLMFVPGRRTPQQVLLDFSRPLLHRAKVHAVFTAGKPYMELVVWGDTQDLNLLKERARLMGLPGPMFGGVEEVSVIAELAGRGSEGGI